MIDKTTFEKSTTAKKLRVSVTHNITFKKATTHHKEYIFSWLSNPHVQEFWDNTQSHKNDILNFIAGRKSPSDYCDGKYIYWIALDAGRPYAMLMTIQETTKDNIGTLKRSHLSKTGHTYGLDYMIGSTEHIGKGYGDKTLIEFINFFRNEFDNKADTFLIDPASDNPRAKHVYEKAGFTHIANFIMGGNCSGSGKLHCLLVKKFKPTITLESVETDDYHIIKKLAQLYVYDTSKELGFSISEDGLYHPKSYRCYCEDKDKIAYLIKVYDEIAGFALINQNGLEEYTDWKVDQFFILAKFQKSGVGKAAAKKIWQRHPGKWEVSVLPENILALNFWEKVITDFTNNTFKKKKKFIDFATKQTERVFFYFNNSTSLKPQVEITPKLAKDLINQQFPEYADLDVLEVEQQGHDNRTYRVGNSLLIRMPTTKNYALKVPIEQKFLPKLEKHLSATIPVPLKMGVPSSRFPYPFSIYQWINGKSANHVKLTKHEIENIAVDLANFLKELQNITGLEGPKPGQHNWWRGNHISIYDKNTRAQLFNLEDTINTRKALDLWERACATKWTSKPVWIHGDFAAGNILIKNARLSGIIDFGGAAMGDPACDLVIAWTYLSGTACEAFISKMNLDSDTWLRSRAWALWKATFELCQIADKTSSKAEIQRKIIHKVLTFPY